MKRRTFLLSAAGGAGALLIGWGAWQRATQLPPGLPPGTTLINGWIELTADGHAVLAVPPAEMRQGIPSALALLPGRYNLTAAVHDSVDPVAYDFHQEAYSFRVVENSSLAAEGIVLLDADWQWRPAAPMLTQPYE